MIIMVTMRKHKNISVTLDPDVFEALEIKRAGRNRFRSIFINGLMAREFGIPKKDR